MVKKTKKENLCVLVASSLFRVSIPVKASADDERPAQVEREVNLWRRNCASVKRKRERKMKENYRGKVYSLVFLLASPHTPSARRLRNKRHTAQDKYLKLWKTRARERRRKVGRIEKLNWLSDPSLDEPWDKSHRSWSANCMEKALTAPEEGVIKPSNVANCERPSERRAPGASFLGIIYGNPEKYEFGWTTNDS